MHLEVLVEERSAEAALINILPCILADDVTFLIHVFQGKPDLLKKLPQRMRGYAGWLGSGVHAVVVVLIDEDRAECRVLKQEMERAAADAGLLTKTSAGSSEPFVVLNRLAIEELEAWFFGDADAIRSAYPGVPNSLEHQAAFRQPDQIAGGTAERLAAVLQRAGYHRGGLGKIQAARDISVHMNVGRNRSPSFIQFVEGLRHLLAQA